MEGVKGRRGGARPGAGRPPRLAVKLFVPPPPAPSAKLPPKTTAAVGSVAAPAALPPHEDPKVFLLALMNNQEADIKIRAEAAKALMPFTHAKPGEVGKKDERKEAAKKAGAGKFAQASAPKLIVNNR
jgi:phage terminase small subunit